MVVGGTGGDLLHLGFDATGQFGDAAELFAGRGDLFGRNVQLAALPLDVTDHRFALLTDVGHHASDFLGGAGCARRQAANLVGDHGEATTCLAGAGGLDGGIERKQIGLTGDGLNHIGDPTDLFGARGQAIDQLTAGMGLRAELLHAFDGALQLGLTGIAALAHRLRRVQRMTRAFGAVLLSGGDGLGTIGDLAHRL